MQSQSTDGGREAPLLLYDTMTGGKRPLSLLEGGRCGIYACGPTVYDMSHIGHARAALVPDILVRFLRARELEVKYVRNVTDVDDKIIKRAAEAGEEPAQLAQRFLNEYRDDMDALGILRPDIEPRVTDHIEEIIATVGALAEAGFAYVVDGDVYYRVERFAAYGRLSGRNLDELQAGARVEVDERKENALDFALWKAAKPGEPSWDSPWGPGRPGWHIECSVMSTKHLGTTFDIHAGGRDLIFPHHENEIAQAQAVGGTDSYARHWIHNGFVNFAGEKMSKSLGNFFTIRELRALYHPQVLRYFLLGVHYRSSIGFDVEVRCPTCEKALSSDEQKAGRCDGCQAEPDTEELRSHVRFPGLEQADERVAYVYDTLQRSRRFLATGRPTDSAGAVTDAVAGMTEGVFAAMADDLNTAAALAAFSEPLSEVNRLLDSGKGVDKGVRRRTIARFVDAMAEVVAVLGVFGQDPGDFLRARRDLKAARIGLDVERVEQLVEERRQARDKKDWETADRWRDELGSMGVTVQDGAEGTTWTL
jgi:cysteinyl-tRNA synthetase